MNLSFGGQTDVYSISEWTSDCLLRVWCAYVRAGMCMFYFILSPQIHIYNYVAADLFVNSCQWTEG